jgi:hypothetical protein
MPSSRRAIILAFAVSTIVACEDPFTRGVPADSPGVAVSGLSEICLGVFGCSAWSPDSKTLYISARVDTSTVPSLVAIDPTTRTVRTIGPLDAGARDFVVPGDGATMYYWTPDRTTNNVWNINRMSLSDGSSTFVARSWNVGFLVSADGTTLAYHAAGSSVGADTVVLLNLVSRVRRAATVDTVDGLAALSADGTRVVMYSGVSAGFAVVVWNTTTGKRDTIPNSISKQAYSIAWSHDSARVLLAAPDGRTFTDTSLAGGSARTYAVGRESAQIGWLPEQSAMWTVPESMVCGPDDCAKYYDFVYTTAAKTTTVGAARATTNFLLLSASPDGRWVAHAEDFITLYFLNQRAP